MSHYWDLVNIEEFGDKRDNFNPERGEVAFYCKDCECLVETERPNPRGYTFVCSVCKGKNVAIGTETGLKENYKIKK